MSNKNILFNLEKSKINPLYVTPDLEISYVKECRICLETSGELISLCGCNGSLKYVHKNCIEQWIAYNGNINICELCNKEYNIQINTAIEQRHCNHLMLTILYLFCIIIIVIIIISFIIHI